MKVSLALKIFRDYQKANLRPSTVAGYRYLINLFEGFFGGKDISSISSEDLYHFLEMITESNSCQGACYLTPLGSVSYDPSGGEGGMDFGFDLGLSFLRYDSPSMMR
jgi:hypothetical protein